VLAVRLESGDGLRDSGARGGRGLDDRRAPGLVRRQVEHHRELGDRPVRSIPLRLVDDEDVGDLQDPRLDRLDVVALPRHEHDRDRVRGAHHVDLVLPDAHGLDEHDLVSRRVEHVDGVGRRARQAAQGAAGRHGPDEDAGVRVDLGHADPVAEDRPARERRGRVDRDDADRAALLPERLRDPLDQGRLAGAGRAGDPDDPGAAGGRKETPQELRHAVGSALDLRDRAADRARPACQDLLGEVRARRGAGAAHRAAPRRGHETSERSCFAMTSFWISLVPSPIVHSRTSRYSFSTGKSLMKP
jgi:hypothetical protein